MGLIVKISGASGYLGGVITERLVKNNHEVSGIHRQLLYGPIDELAGEIEGSDVIINLAGAPVLQRWTWKNRQIIFESRVVPTSHLVQAVNRLKPEKRPQVFISASAIGIYRAGMLHNEESREFDNGFIGRLVQAWEEPLLELPQTTRRFVFRIGLVLGKKAKTISSVLPMYRMGAKVVAGNGRQPFPFIHEKDVSKAFQHAAEGLLQPGIYNLAAPLGITALEFARALSREIKTFAGINMPPLFFRLMYGEAAVLLLESPAIEPQALLNAGFDFEHPTIESALSEIISKKNPA